MQLPASVSADDSLEVWKRGKRIIIMRPNHGRVGSDDIPSVPSIDGRTAVTLPPGTPGGSKLRLKHHGVQRRGPGGRGDMYVVIRIVPPATLNDEQRAAFEKLREHDDPDPRGQCKWWKG